MQSLLNHLMDIEGYRHVIICNFCLSIRCTLAICSVHDCVSCCVTVQVLYAVYRVDFVAESLISSVCMFMYVCMFVFMLIFLRQSTFTPEMSSLMEITVGCWTWKILCSVFRHCIVAPTRSYTNST